MDTLPASCGAGNGIRSLPDSPDLEMQLSDDQRAALECSAEINDHFRYGVPPSDAEIDAMYAEQLAREQQERDAHEQAHADAVRTSAIIGRGNIAIIDAVTALFDRRAS